MNSGAHDSEMHILPSLEEITSKKCILTGRRQLDWERNSVVEYDDDARILVKRPAEKSNPASAVDISPIARIWSGQGLESPLKFFLDGSRRTYKIADVPIRDRLMPLVAGQVGVGVCRREGRKIRPRESLKMQYVLAVPAALNPNGKDHKRNRAFFNKMRTDINATSTRLKLDEILFYSTEADQDAEDRAIMAIQDYMMEREKEAVRKLVNAKQLGNESWLVKDGSLEYPKVDESNPYHYARVKDNYMHVVGVSKSFNPDLMRLKGGKSASRELAELKPFHRTPAFRYKYKRADGEFAIWYVRIRNHRGAGQSPFDGIVKVEKLLVSDSDVNEGLDSNEINNISAWLVNERNPVCFGKDARWANHIYPVHLTESYVKSKYMSAECFTHLF